MLESSGGFQLHTYCKQATAPVNCGKCRFSLSPLLAIWHPQSVTVFDVCKIPTSQAPVYLGGKTLGSVRKGDSSWMWTSLHLKKVRFPKAKTYCHQKPAGVPEEKKMLHWALARSPAKDQVGGLGLASSFFGVCFSIHFGCLNQAERKHDFL